MKKLASTLPNMIASLGLISILSGAALGAMYVATEKPIARQALEQQLKAISEVAPHFDNNPKAEACTIATPSGIHCILFPAREGNKLVGAAVEATTMEGFNGEITVMTGFDLEGKLTGYTVLKHAETPGLGSKMETWFRDPAGARTVIGKSPALTKFRVTKDAGGEIDGITAATISSRAFLGALRGAFDAYRQMMEKELGKGSIGSAVAQSDENPAEKPDTYTTPTRRERHRYDDKRPQ